MILTHDSLRHNREAILFPRSVYIILYLLNLVPELPEPLTSSLPTIEDFEGLDAEIGNEEEGEEEGEE